MAVPVVVQQYRRSQRWRVDKDTKESSNNYISSAECIQKKWKLWSHLAWPWWFVVKLFTLINCNCANTRECSDNEQQSLVLYTSPTDWAIWPDANNAQTNAAARHYDYAFNSCSASHDNWCTGTLWNWVITAQCEGMGEVGSERYEPALLPPCPSIRALCYSNCQRSTQSHQQSKG